MSFRKRGELLSSRSAPLLGPSPVLAGRVPSRVPQVPVSKSPLTPKEDIIAENVAVRPSTVSSQPAVSTGCPDLDKLLVHSGLPLGNSLLVEELGTTDFASVLLRGFAAQGVLHNRMDKNSHVVVVGMPAAWANDLPGEYKGSSKDQKKAKIVADASKISVTNMAEKDLKIAWRYGINSTPDTRATENNVHEHYSIQLDITQRLVPRASAQDISFVPLGPAMTKQITSVVKMHAKDAKKVVRLVIPLFLNPSLYPYQYSQPTFVIPFLHSMRALLTQHSNVVLMASLPLDLYPRNGMLTHMFETLADGVVHLQPFNPEMAALVEKAYKNEPSKIQQGLVNVIKVPILSDRGMMMVRDGEHAFRNGRKKFEIEEWGIPVEDEGEEEKKIDF